MGKYIGFYMEHRYVLKNRERLQIPLDLTPILTLHYAPIEFAEQVREIRGIHAANCDCKNPKCTDHESLDLCMECDFRDRQLSFLVQKIGYENWKAERLEVPRYDAKQFQFNNGDTVEIIGDEILIWE